jgi:hypothetical protein
VIPEFEENGYLPPGVHFCEFGRYAELQEGGQGCPPHNNLIHNNLIILIVEL